MPRKELGLVARDLGFYLTGRCDCTAARIGLPRTGFTRSTGAINWTGRTNILRLSTKTEFLYVKFQVPFRLLICLRELLHMVWRTGTVHRETPKPGADFSHAQIGSPASQNAPFATTSPW